MPDLHFVVWLLFSFAPFFLDFHFDFYSRFWHSIFQNKIPNPKTDFDFGRIYIYSHIHITSPSIDISTCFHLQCNYITTTPACQAQFTRKFICLRVDLSICQVIHLCQMYRIKHTSAHISNKQHTKRQSIHIYSQPVN